MNNPSLFFANLVTLKGFFVFLMTATFAHIVLPDGVAVAIGLAAWLYIAAFNGPMHCPYCGKGTKLGYTTCHHCGRDTV